MTTSVRELLEQGAARPTGPVDVDDLARTAGRRRRNRRGIAAALVAVVALVSVIAVVDLDGGSERSVVVPPAAGSTLEPRFVPDGWTAVSDADAGLALAIPPGWQVQAAHEATTPRNVMVVGTAPLPPDDPLAACTEDTALPAPGTWVTISEYDAGGPFPFPRGASRSDVAGGAVMESDFRPRPVPVRYGTGCSEHGVDTNDSWVVFTDGGRHFFARVVVVNDAPAEGSTESPVLDALDEGDTVIDTLAVAPFGGAAAPPAGSELAPRHVPDGWTTVSDPAVGIALAVPPTWSRLATEIDGLAPNILQVGSTALAQPDAPAACSPLDAVPDEPGTWVSLYEYPPGGPFLFPHSGGGGVDAGAFDDRPAEFATTAGFQLRCIDPTDAPETRDNALDYFLWQEQGRFFLARVVVVDDPTGAGLELGRQVLDTLRVAPSAATTPDATTTSTPQPSGAASVPPPTLAQSEDEQALRAVLVSWMDGERADRVREYVDDYDELAPYIAQGMAQHSPSTLASFRGVVDDVTFLDETHASFHFTQSKLGQVLFRHLPGTAVRIDGEWKVSRETMCEHLARGGIRCPPRSAS